MAIILMAGDPPHNAAEEHVSNVVTGVIGVCVLHFFRHSIDLTACLPTDGGNSSTGCLANYVPRHISGAEISGKHID